MSVCNMYICIYFPPCSPLPTPGWFIKPFKESTSLGYHQSMRWNLVSEMKAENIKSFLW